MQFNVVLIDANGNTTTHSCTARRLPSSVDALLNVLDACGHSDLISRIENQASSHTLRCDSAYEDLQSDVDNDSFSDYSISAKIDDGDESDIFDDLEDGGTLYLQEAPSKTRDEDEGASDESGDGSDVALITIVVKVHGGDKSTVHVPVGTTVDAALSKSGVRIPAGASYAFNGNDISPNDKLSAGGMLTAAGKVLGG